MPCVLCVKMVILTCVLVVCCCARQLSSKETVAKEDLQQKWQGLCLPLEQLDTLLALGNFSTDITWMNFFALGCSTLGGVRGSGLNVSFTCLTYTTVPPLLPVSLILPVSPI